MILGQEAGKEHAVPMLVGEFLGQLVDALLTVGTPDITYLTATRAESVSQGAVLGSEVSEWLSSINGPPLQG